jgi:hypothetical protein
VSYLSPKKYSNHDWVETISEIKFYISNECAQHFPPTQDSSLLPNIQSKSMSQSKYNYGHGGYPIIATTSVDM